MKFIIVYVFKTFLCFVPVANAPDVLQPAGLLYNPKSLTFQLSPQVILNVTKMPATLAVKGGTIGREMAGKFGLKIAS
jgi:hypothetical protein